MAIITAENICVSFGIETILENVSFTVNKGDRVGIVGANGAGKSTLFRVITKDLEPDEGSVVIDREATVGYVKQREHFDPGAIGRDILGRISNKSLIADESIYDKEIDLLSGGEKTRLALAVALSEQPSLLLLDEPTNHLDIPTLNWLEKTLKNYKGTLLIISHDRYFLDRICSRIFEIENCRLKAYSGNYTSYKEQKQRNYEIELRHYENEMAEIKRQEEMIRRFKEHNTEHLVKRAQSREARLKHIVRPVKPTQLTESLRMNFSEKLSSGNDVVFAQDLSFGYGEPLFRNVSLDIKKHDRICIVGANGTGKTTLLKLITGQLLPQSGRIRLGQNVTPAYYDQEQQNLDPGNTVLEELHGTYFKYDVTDLRRILGSFLFTGDDVFKTVADLAGGEKARLSLLKLMMSGCNLLILDEPTNHLDISAKEVFEEAIRKFPGTVIIVSHDRYLLQTVPTAILELGKNGVTMFPGQYDYYSEKRAGLAAGGRLDPAAGRSGSGAPGAESASGESSYELRKAQKAADRKAQKALENAENRVLELEQRTKELERQLCLPEVYQDADKALEISQALSEAKADLEAAYGKWMELQ